MFYKRKIPGVYFVKNLFSLIPIFVLFILFTNSALLAEDEKSNKKVEERHLSPKQAYAELTVAVNKGYEDVIIKILKQYPKLVNIRDKFKRTPVFNAVLIGKFDIVKLLMKKGANVSIGNMYGDTPLHKAAQNGNIKIMKLLLLKAKVYTKNKKGESPLFKAAASGKLDAAKLLITKGASVHTTDNKGNTPLHIASERGQVDMCKLLIENMAYIKTKNKADKTAIDVAKDSKTKNYLEGILNQD